MYDRKVRINGSLVSARKMAQTYTDYKFGAKYIKSRREATRRSKQIREKTGPASMEWVQSALFLYASKKNHLQTDLRSALWAYTSALILKLEDLMTDANKLAKRGDIVDSYKWVAQQLRFAINKHMKLLDMVNGQDIIVPEPTEVGRDIKNAVHRPTKKDANDMMDYMLCGFKRNHPEAADLLPKKDSDLV